MKLLILALLAALLLAGCGTTADAGTNAPVATATPISTTVPVAITIVDAKTGAPVQSAFFADEQQVTQNVTERTLHLRADGLRHAVAVRAEGYQEWQMVV